MGDNAVKYQGAVLLSEQKLHKLMSSKGATLAGGETLHESNTLVLPIPKKAVLERQIAYVLMHVMDILSRDEMSGYCAVNEYWVYFFLFRKLTWVYDETKTSREE